MDQVEIGIVSLSRGGSCKLEKRLEGGRRSVVLASWFRSLDGSMGGGAARERERASGCFRIRRQGSRREKDGGRARLGRTRARVRGTEQRDHGSAAVVRDRG